ncbi:MAG: hypothetical protein ABI824_11610, partial [Acidobacteriota bacterium]
MTRHLTNDELRKFQERSLDPQRLLQADRHLAACSECRGVLRQAGSKPTIPELAPITEGPLHPSYEQLSAYIHDKNSVGSEWIQGHVLACTNCAAELQDMQAFDIRLTNEAAFPPLAAATPSATGVFDRLQEWLRGPESSPYGNGRFAFSSAALLAVGIGLMAQVRLSHTEGLASPVGINGATGSPASEFEFYAGLAVLIAGAAALPIIAILAYGTT